MLNYTCVYIHIYIYIYIYIYIHALFIARRYPCGGPESHRAWCLGPSTLGRRHQAPEKKARLVVTYLYVYMYNVLLRCDMILYDVLCVYMCVYIYIGETKYINLYIYIYIHTHVYVYVVRASPLSTLFATLVTAIH